MNEEGKDNIESLRSELGRLALALGSSTEKPVQAFALHCLKFIDGTIDSYPTWSSQLESMSQATITQAPFRDAVRAVESSFRRFEYGAIMSEDAEAFRAIYDRLCADTADSGPLTTTLFRPVGPEELELIKESNWERFPPRLPEQPIFYPVTNLEYAAQIAKRWNVKESGTGFVTSFSVEVGYVSQFPIETVGGRIHKEYWIPAERLEEFNDHIRGPIEVVETF